MDQSQTEEKRSQSLTVNISNNGYSALTQSLALDNPYLATFLVQVRYLALFLGSMDSYGNIFPSYNMKRVHDSSKILLKELSDLLSILFDIDVGSLTWDEYNIALKKLEKDLSTAKILVDSIRQC